MAGSDNSMEQMFNMWQEGQNAFFGAQKEMADTFAKTFSEPFTPKPKDPAMQGYEVWQNFVKAWAPSWDPAAAMRMTPNSFAGNTDAMFGAVLARGVGFPGGELRIRQGDFRRLAAQL